MARSTKPKSELKSEESWNDRFRWLTSKPGLVILAIAGAGYFGLFSQIDGYAPIRGYLLLVPIQVGIVLVLLWQKRRSS